MLENAGKIANLFRGTKEERQTAFVLLDSLIDFVRDVGIQHEFADRVEVFNGMNDIRPNGMLPIPDIYQEIFLQKESMNQEEAFIIEEDLIVPLWELYFRLFPEKLEDLPSKIKISHCHRLPNFCGPESHIRGIEFVGPTFGVDGLEKCTQLVRVHFSLGWLDNGWLTLEKEHHLAGWHTSDQWINAHQSWYHENFKNRTLATVDQWFPRLMAMPNIRHYFDEMSTFDDDQRAVMAADIPNLISTNLRVRDLHKSNVLYNAFRPNYNVKGGYNYPQAYSHVTIRRQTSEGLQVVWRKNDNTNIWSYFQHDTAIDIPRVNSCTKERIDWELVIDAELGNVFANTTYTLQLNDETDKPLHQRLIQFEGDVRHIFSNTLDFPNLRLAKFKRSKYWWADEDQRIRLDQAWLARCPRLEAVSFDCIYNEYSGENSKYHNNWYAGIARVFDTDFFYAEHPLRYLYVAGSDGEDTSKAQLAFSGNGALRDRLYELKADMDFISRFKRHMENVARVVMTGTGYWNQTLYSLTSFKHGTQIYLEDNWFASNLLKAPNPFENFVSPTLPEHALYHKKEIRNIHTWEEIELWFARILEGHHTTSDVHLSQRFLRIFKKRLAKNDVPETFAKVMNGRSHIRIGKHWLFHIDGQWSLKERRHLKNFDADYCRRGQRISVLYWNHEYKIPCVWNLHRAYYARSYTDGTLPKFLDKALYNTKKVPLSALQAKSELNTLKVEVVLDRSDYLELSKLDQVKFLYLNKQGLSDIPLEVCQMKNLKHLFLSDNDLSDLPRELSNLSNLEILGLTRNNLTSVPAVLDDLPNLKKLYISQSVYNNLNWDLVMERGIQIQIIQG